MVKVEDTHIALGAVMSPVWLVEVADLAVGLPLADVRARPESKVKRDLAWVGDKDHEVAPHVHEEEEGEHRDLHDVGCVHLWGERELPLS